MSGWDLVLMSRSLTDYLGDIIEAHPLLTNEPSSDWASLTYGAVVASYILEKNGCDPADPDLAVLIQWREKASPTRLVQPYEGADRVATAARAIIKRQPDG